MKNTLTDLNNYLFESIERLNDDELTDEQLEKEIKRSEAVHIAELKAVSSKVKRRNMKKEEG